MLVHAMIYTDDAFTGSQGGWGGSQGGYGGRINATDIVLARLW